MNRFKFFHYFIMIGLLIGVIGLSLSQPKLSRAATVVFNDANLEQCVRDTIGKPVGDIDSSEVAGVTQLDCFAGNIGDLTGLEYFSALQSLSAANGTITDLTPIAGLTALTSVGFSSNNITDLTPIAGLTALTSAYLSNNSIADLAPFLGLVNLDILYLDNNNIGSTAGLQNLTALHQLSLDHNPIGDNYSNIQNLASLTVLSMMDCGITGTLLSFPAPLVALNLSNNSITDPSSLGVLWNLVTTDLSYNQIGALGIENLWQTANPCGGGGCFTGETRAEGEPRNRIYVTHNTSGGIWTLNNGTAYNRLHSFKLHEAVIYNDLIYTQWPDGGEVWEEGTVHTIYWNIIGNSEDPDQIAQVKIEYAASPDAEEWTTITDATLSDSSGYDWYIPFDTVVSDSEMWVRITGASSGSGSFDMNDSFFTVVDQNEPHGYYVNYGNGNTAADCGDEEDDDDACGTIEALMDENNTVFRPPVEHSGDPVTVYVKGTLTGVDDDTIEPSWSVGASSITFQPWGNDHPVLDDVQLKINEDAVIVSGFEIKNKTDNAGVIVDASDIGLVNSYIHHNSFGIEVIRIAHPMENVHIENNIFANNRGEIPAGPPPAPTIDACAAIFAAGMLDGLSIINNTFYNNCDAFDGMGKLGDLFIGSLAGFGIGIAPTNSVVKQNLFLNDDMGTGAHALYYNVEDMINGGWENINGIAAVGVLTDEDAANHGTTTNFIAATDPFVNAAGVTNWASASTGFGLTDGDAPSYQFTWADRDPETIDSDFNGDARPDAGGDPEAGALENGAPAGPVCGNSIVEAGEQCDGAELNGQTCITQGYASGTLSCNANCTLNLSACSSGSGGGSSTRCPAAPIMDLSNSDLTLVYGPDGNPGVKVDWGALSSAVTDAVVYRSFSALSGFRPCADDSTCLIDYSVVQDPVKNVAYSYKMWTTNYCGNTDFGQTATIIIPPRLIPGTLVDVNARVVVRVKEVRDEVFLKRLKEALQSQASQDMAYQDMEYMDYNEYSLDDEVKSAECKNAESALEKWVGSFDDDSLAKPVPPSSLLLRSFVGLERERAFACETPPDAYGNPLFQEILASRLPFITEELVNVISETRLTSWRQAGSWVAQWLLEKVFGLVEEFYKINAARQDLYYNIHDRIGADKLPALNEKIQNLSVIRPDDFTEAERQLIAGIPDIADYLKGHKEDLILKIWNPGDRTIPVRTILIHTDIFGEADVSVLKMAAGRYDFTIETKYALRKGLYNVPVLSGVKTGDRYVLDLELDFSRDAKEALKFGDLNGDGEIDLSDFKYMAAVFSELREEVDWNEDGKFDLNEFVYMLQRFGHDD
ncbi:hypothetical protein JXA05_03690 [Candidatus Peregrinibacteria bacterium]|nr:hypothetical protein [Candidatus Peregrinibacteria bacterium]